MPGPAAGSGTRTGWGYLATAWLASFTDPPPRSTLGVARWWPRPAARISRPVASTAAPATVSRRRPATHRTAARPHDHDRCDRRDGQAAGGQRGRERRRAAGEEVPGAAPSGGAEDD